MNLCRHVLFLLRMRLARHQQYFRYSPNPQGNAVDDREPKAKGRSQQEEVCMEGSDEPRRCSECCDGCPQGQHASLRPLGEQQLVSELVGQANHCNAQKILDFSRKLL